MARRLLTAIAPFTFTTHFIPGVYSYGADFLSRYSETMGKALPDVLDAPSDPSDLCAYVNIIGANKPETTEQYLARSKQNAKTLLAQERGSFDHKSEVKAVFKESHYFKNYKNADDNVNLLRELNNLSQQEANEPVTTKVIQNDPMNPFSMLYENCVVKPELFQDVKPEKDAIHESGEFAPDVTQAIAGAHTKGMGVFSKSKFVDANVASGRNNCPWDFLDAHTDKKVCPYSKDEKAIM
jgi:hypothetical protein